MKLVAICKNCRSEIRVIPITNDRAELARKKGDSFQLRCNECEKKYYYHVNKVKAKKSKWLALSALIILTVGTVVVGYLLFNISRFSRLIVIPSIVYFIINRQETNNIEQFNSYRT